MLILCFVNDGCRLPPAVVSFPGQRGSVNDDLTLIWSLNDI